MWSFYPHKKYQNRTKVKSTELFEVPVLVLTRIDNLSKP